MPVILHKFRDHDIAAFTETLILGTFNPDIPGGPDFFYGRTRNFLWHLLPSCWALPSLRNQTLAAKQRFMSEQKIDFADIIHAINVPDGNANNVQDAYIDNHIIEFKDIITTITFLPKLKAIYFTRRTFAGIPNIHNAINAIQGYCIENNIRFCLLLTPARFYNLEKQLQWRNTIVDLVNCART